MNRIPLLFLTLILSTGNITFAQAWKNLGTDELFDLARKEAFDGKRDSARVKLKFALEKSPNYSDIRILLGRTYAWDGQRDAARKELQTVLNQEPEYQDAINALVDVEMWDDQYETALHVVNNGLKTYPTFDDFLYKKASILNSLERFEESMVTVNQLISLYPGEQRGPQLREGIKTSQQRWTAGARVSGDYYSKGGNAYALYSSASLGRSNDWGSSILRINYARRFGINGFQTEVDLYPTVAKKMYAYVNYGFSNTSLFPKHRVGLELYRSLPHSFEASAGLRYLVFRNSVTIYTGSLGWYHKSMWFSLRPFITPDKKAGSSISGSFTARKYFGNPNTYLEFSGGMGFSPELRQFQSTNGVSADQIYVLKSQRLGTGFQHQLKYNWRIGANLGVSNQELSRNVGNYMKVISLAGTVTYLF